MPNLKRYSNLSDEILMNKTLEPVNVLIYASRFLNICRVYFLKISGIFFPDGRKIIPFFYASILLNKITALFSTLGMVINCLIKRLNIVLISDLKDGLGVN